MLEFEPFSLSALQKVLPYIKNNPSRCSDLSSGYLFMWHEDADVHFCVWDDTFIVRQIIGEQIAFSYPFGKNPNGMIDKLVEYTSQNHLPLRFFAVDDETLNVIYADDRLHNAMSVYDRRWSDYIYSFEKAMTFSGKKYSGQRNHINKFKKLYGEPDIRLLTYENQIDVKALLVEYAAEHQDRQTLEHMELEQAEKLFDVCNYLGLYPAGLFVDGKLAAFSIGEIVKDTLLIHVEKALTIYEGIYPTMYSGFVNLITDCVGHPLTFVNREDDSGDMGLRTSKLQYHPVMMANKYLVHIDSPTAKIGSSFSFTQGGVVLTEIRESDKHIYLELNTDITNNQYWGYDYRKDINITEPVNDNTFYDSTMYDMRAGDSINFAIRLSENGEMIGEAILWNFSSDGSAELGCRILPKYQGNGYGKDAFGAAAHAAHTLNINVWARCYRDNKPSYHMIVANGFIPIREDQDFCYFKQDIN